MNSKTAHEIDGVFISADGRDPVRSQVEVEFRDAPSSPTQGQVGFGLVCATAMLTSSRIVCSNSFRSRPVVVGAFHTRQRSALIKARIRVCCLWVTGPGCWRSLRWVSQPALSTCRCRRNSKMEEMKAGLEKLKRFDPFLHDRPPF